jgi:hypothetical protein
VERANAALELREEVLLIATSVGLTHDLLEGHRTVVGDVEEVAIVLPEAELPAFLDDRLAQSHEAVGATRLVGSVFELGKVLSGQAQVLVLALANDLLRDPRRFSALLADFERLVRPSYELSVFGLVNIVSVSALFDGAEVTLFDGSGSRSGAPPGGGEWEVGISA